MTAAVIVLGVVVLALLWMLRAERADHRNQLADVLNLERMERQQLADRIQRPELLPTAPAARAVDPEALDKLRAAAAARARVGRVKLARSPDDAA